MATFFEVMPGRWINLDHITEVVDDVADTDGSIGVALEFAGDKPEGLVPPSVLIGSDRLRFLEFLRQQELVARYTCKETVAALGQRLGASLEEREDRNELIRVVEVLLESPDVGEEKKRLFEGAAKKSGFADWRDAPEEAIRVFFQLIQTLKDIHRQN